MKTLNKCTVKDSPFLKTTFKEKVSKLIKPEWTELEQEKYFNLSRFNGNLAYSERNFYKAQSEYTGQPDY